MYDNYFVENWEKYPPKVLDYVEKGMGEGTIAQVKQRKSRCRARTRAYRRKRLFKARRKNKKIEQIMCCSPVYPGEKQRARRKVRRMSIDFERQYGKGNAYRKKHYIR